MTQPTLALIAQPSHGNFMERHPGLRELIANSTLTTDAVAQAIKLIRGAYRTLNDELPESHQWKHSKLAHAGDCADEVEKHASLFGLQNLECAVFQFLLFGHDIGRLDQGLRRVRGEEALDADHGRLSVERIKEALGATVETTAPIWTAMFEAIRCHSFRVTPTVEELGGSEAVHGLVCLLRDTDKLGGWNSAKSYTGDPERQARERRANWTAMIEADPAWGNELGLISPPYHLWDPFLHGRLLERAKCRSYEAYMLQLLAWLYDVNTPEMLDIIIERGGPNIVFEYLVTRLTIGATKLESAAERDEAAHQLAALKQWATEWREGILHARHIAAMAKRIEQGENKP